MIYEIPLIDDFHVHLRQGEIMNNVTKLLSKGGVGRVLVMPNLSPIINNTKMALSYKKELESVNPNIEYFMTLYLQPNLTIQELKEAKEGGIKGIKSYPRGVTTGSEAGNTDYESYYFIFEEMEKLGLILNLHGEVPSNPENNICIMNAEEKFLHNLIEINRKFPNLKVVLEHITTESAVKVVNELNTNVVATITPHHLDLIIDDWAGQNHNYCKPIAKFPQDRLALQNAVKSGNSKFFLGSDSAPHKKHTKENAHACAGVFSSPDLLLYLADTFDKLSCLNKLKDFCCTFGRNFYDLPEQTKTIKITKTNYVVPEEYSEIVPYRAKQALNWAFY